MKLEIKNGLRILYPTKNKILVNKDKTEVYDGEIYLGKYDAQSNYLEVTRAEADEIITREEAKRKAEETLREKNL